MVPRFKECPGGYRAAMRAPAQLPQEQEQARAQTDERRMFKDFEAQTFRLAKGIQIHGVVGGSGPPVLLLHGFPQTHVCWHKLAPHLASRFTVVATDLRGYGASSKPEGGENHINYSKRSMALDQVEAMRQLGFNRFRIVGHDRGGRVAHRLALDHPEAVERLVVLDVAPTATMYAGSTRSFAEAYYHWFFLIQPFDLPERLIGANAEYFLRWTLNAWCKVDGAITEDALAAYLQAFQSPGAIHAACEDYRAAATIDLEHDTADERAGRRLTMPMLALWGARGTVAKEFDIWQAWRDKSASQVLGKDLYCGHFVPEEAPDETLTEFLHFL
jgi:haloacetate dehalogenase